MILILFTGKYAVFRSRAREIKWRAAGRVEGE
jgi:hypothetical protein